MILSALTLALGCSGGGNGETVGRVRLADGSSCPRPSSSPVSPAAYNPDAFGAVPSYAPPIPGDESSTHSPLAESPPAERFESWPTPTLVPSVGLGWAPGKFAVGDDGSANYSIPISVPPGRMGMEPELSISYNSNSGSGYLGVGFSLAGLSAITRCDQNYSDDDTMRRVALARDDRFCLSGLRLVAVRGEYGADGTEYRTRPDSFVKIVSHGGNNGQDSYTGPQSFTVYDKSGDLREFGGADASVEVGPVTVTWSLKSVQDRSGNTMEVTYEKLASDKGTEEHYPIEIRYGAHSSGLLHDKFVRFEYAARLASEVITSYAYGARARITKILHRIAVLADGGQTTVRVYDLNFEADSANQRNLLNAVRECDVGGSICKRPTEFVWATSRPEFLGPSSTEQMPAVDQAGQNVVMDADGDGRDDIVYPDKERWNIVFGAKERNPSPAATHLSTHVRTDAPTNDALSVGFLQRGFPIDYDQDGKTDLLLADISPTWRYLRSTGDNFQLINTGIPRSKRTIYNLYYGGGSESRDSVKIHDHLMMGFYLVDLNGDGIKDLLERDLLDDWRPNPPTPLCQGDMPWSCGGKWTYRMHDGRSGFGPAIEVPELFNVSIAAPVLPLDADGDGKEELLIDTCAVYTGIGNVAVIPPSCGPTDGNGKMLNDNGQFKIFSWQKLPGQSDPNKGTFSIADAGFSTRYEAPGISQNIGQQQVIVPIDANGDGLKDLIASTDTRPEYYFAPNFWLNSGKGFVRRTDSGLESLGANKIHLEDSLVIDYDADGREELFFAYGDTVLHSPGQYLPPALREAKRYFRFRTTATANELVFSYSGEQLPYEKPAELSVFPTRRGPRVADVNGDGLQDIISDFGGLLHWREHAKNNQVGEKVDAIVTIREGRMDGAFDQPSDIYLGSLYLDYRPLINAYGKSIAVEGGKDLSQIYFQAEQNQATCVYPCKRFVGPKYVVSRTSEDTGTRFGRSTKELYGRYTFHRYEDAYVDRHGRGWLGFRAHVQYEYHEDESGPKEGIYPVTARWTRAIYDPTTYDATQRIYPNGGVPLWSIAFGYQRASMGAEDPALMWLSIERATPSVHKTNGNKTYFVETPFESTRTYENLPYGPLQPGLTLDPEAMLQSASAYRGEGIAVIRDDFGNSTSTRVSHWTRPDFETSRLSISETLTSYLNDEPRWIIGRVRTTKVTDQTPEGSQARQYEAFYQRDTGLLERQTIATPSDDAHWLDTEIERDRFGNIVRSTTNDALDVFRGETVVTYDPDGVFPHAIRNALGHTTRIKYNPYLGVPIAMVSANGLISWRVYDAFGNLRREHEPDGSLTTYWLTRDRDGELWGPTLHAQDSTGVTSGARLDRLGRAVYDWSYGLRGQRSESIRTFWDFGGTKTASIPARSASTSTPKWSFSYDARHRPSTKVAPDGVTVSRTYREFEEWQTDGKGEQNHFVFDGRGQVVRSEDANRLPTTYRYGPFGSLLSVDVNGSKTEYTVDDYGRTLRVVDPDFGARALVYDAFGLRSVETDNKGQDTLSCHDALGRLTRESSPDGTDIRTYDQGANAIGKLTASISAGRNGRRYEYDALGRLSRTTTLVPSSGSQLQSYTIERAYNARGELHRLTYPSVGGSRFAVDYLYDDYGNSTTVRDASDQHVMWRWQTADDANRISDVQFGNGVAASKVYNGNTGLLRTLTSSSPSVAQLQNLEYAFDENRNLKSRTDHRQQLAENFSYDSLDRLVRSESSAANAAYEYKYDDIGNIVYKSDVGTYVYDRANKPHAVRSVNGRIYDYDPNGNQILRPTGPADDVEIEYTAFDKPRLIRKPGGEVTFEYDADGERLRKTSGTKSTTYIDGLYERHADGPKLEHKMYVSGPDGLIAIVTLSQTGTGDIARKERYVHGAHDASVDVITNEQGMVVERRSYDPFGQARNPDWATGGGPTEPKTESVGYTGHEDEDDLELVNMGGRIYDPKIARFLSPDPITEAPYFSQSWNRYAYVFNNPLTFIDPAGFETTKNHDRPASRIEEKPSERKAEPPKDDSKPDQSDSGSGDQYGHRATPRSAQHPLGNAAQAVTQAKMGDYAGAVKSAIKGVWQIATRSVPQPFVYRIPEAIRQADEVISQFQEGANVRDGARRATEKYVEQRLRDAPVVGRVLRAKEAEKASQEATDPVSKAGAVGDDWGEVADAAAEAGALVFGGAKSAESKGVKGGRGAGADPLYMRGTKAGPRLHGDLPHAGDLRGMPTDRLSDLRDMTKTSLQTRTDEMRDRGDKGGHGSRIGEERQLLERIERELKNRGAL
ncbi:hypothetical protein LVJ94_40905 [Pendulispora rubella]|uniref:Teneurin-like YD-shell domain-containing protein n=1 Tax=Pendulispora rubella TaxID=2741070 RepID=A0ABZ2L3N1_9BACT